MGGLPDTMPTARRIFRQLMAKLLLMESDPVAAAVLEDRLRVAGYSVEILADLDRAVARIDTEQIDLVVLGMAGEAAEALDALHALRAHPGTRSVALVVLADGKDPAWRVEVLRAGADDFLTRPFDPEELVIRVERLLGSRLAKLQLLQGDLATHPLWAVLQYLQQVNKTGHLRVHGGNGSGTIDLRAGELVAARWQGLRGQDALVTLLAVEEGSFRFDGSEAAEITGEGTGTLSMNELLMQAAWLKDELEKRRNFLPATGEPLLAVAELPKVQPEFAGLPLQRILGRIQRQPGIRLFDLMTDEAEAPLTTRLCVAWLCEQGALLPRDKAAGMASPQSTVEISNALVFDLAIDDLVTVATAAGLPASTLPYLVLVEAPVWPQLRRLIETAPGFPANEELRTLVDHVELHRAGSAHFTAGNGKLALHVQVLTAAAPPALATLVPECAGVLLWLAGAAVRDQARPVVQRLETGRLAATGILLATTPAGQSTAAELAKGTRKWRTSPHAPRSLLGILRLLYPR
ncbi:MAG TPA: hypothetical protein DD490_33475 [Acidobacteria bacterium]|nr:hypothetical protein [Acidobacteriota bacterium]